MQAYVIFNAHAGTGVQADEVRQVVAEREGLELVETRSSGHAGQLARQAVERGVEQLVVAGGDGTVSEVINGLGNWVRRVRLLIVPLGTGNDFSRTLGLPHEVRDALDLLEHGMEQRIDLVWAGGEHPRYIVNAATGGFSELVHQKLRPDIKESWGPLAYLRAAVEAAPEISEYQVRLTLDGEVLESRAWSVIIANGRYAGGGFALAPQASVQDAAVDVLLVTAETFLHRLMVASQFAAGTQVGQEGVVFRRARRVEVTAEPAMSFSSDGELIGHTPMEFCIAPNVLRVLVPPSAPSV